MKNFKNFVNEASEAKKCPDGQKLLQVLGTSMKNRNYGINRKAN